MAKLSRVATSTLDPGQFSQFIDGAYTDKFKLHVGGAAGLYFDYTFMQNSFAASGVWQTHIGRYNDLRGYWIFRPDVDLCWQAVNACGVLDYWNRDGRATGTNPQDWELFVPEVVDAGTGAIRIRNVYGCYIRYNASQPPPYPPFPGALGAFVCDQPVSNAATFYIDFGA